VHGLAAEQDGSSVLLTAAAGEEWESFVGLCVADRLAGVEALSGIPGLVGASPVQNIGAYGQDVSQTITAVRAYDRQACEVVVLSGAVRLLLPAQRLQGRAGPLGGAGGGRSRYPVGAVRAGRLRRAGPLARRAGRRAGSAGRGARGVLRLRRGKGMVLDAADVDTRSAGSFFTNPLLPPEQLAALLERVPSPPPTWPEPDGRTKVSAAWLIERAGFARAPSTGRSGSPASTRWRWSTAAGRPQADLRAVAAAVQDGVRAAFGVELVPEPVFVGEPLRSGG
jgi:UDP-N-acetylmuramate dehydrogenase